MAIIRKRIEVVIKIFPRAFRIEWETFPRREENVRLECIFKETINPGTNL